MKLHIEAIALIDRAISVHESNRKLAVQDPDTASRLQNKIDELNKSKLKLVLDQENHHD